MNKKIQNEIIQLFQNHFNQPVLSTEMLPPSGSYREYIRLKSADFTAIGTWNNDHKENLAFVEFSRTLRQGGVLVPEIYMADLEKQIYLQEDLGDTTLFAYLSEVRAREGFSEPIINIYKSIVRALPNLQIEAGNQINTEYCYPRKAFDQQSMMWDLNYFKYYFLKLAKVHFDEQALEDDYITFSNYLLKADCNYFMLRDFQSRNILLKEGSPWYIDYQGGRKGALQYDLASLLFDAKADIPQSIREELIECYLDELEKHISVDRNEFKQYFYGYVLIRLMQAMGAYGFRGFYEKKAHFLKSIPYAIENLSIVLRRFVETIRLPELFKVLESLKNSEVLKNIAPGKSELMVSITSFSFKKGYPADQSGNGGGFVFDCRALPNPGRFVEYKNVSGKDKPVIDFFKDKPEMDEFLSTAFKLVDSSIEKYSERGFTHLDVNFGCTGGQHRSVFSAERLADHIRTKYSVKVDLLHRELESLGL